MNLQEFPPALLVVSPRLTKHSNPSSSVAGINTILLAEGALTYCEENRETYRLNKADNSTPPDGDKVIAPLTGPGAARLARRAELGDQGVRRTG